MNTSPAASPAEPGRDASKSGRFRLSRRGFVGTATAATGAPLLLVHGWPENWYAWRFLMPTLAKSYTVVAVDQRGIGLTEQTTGGYDAATVATDMAAVMTQLGHEQFAVVGHDTGYVLS